ncbi:MAG TPA: NUDIX domain-containing protein [Fervidobacterium nodosum]|nr:NUDIX domain-containing protein [Fervidobacterium nodosum]
MKYTEIAQKLINSPKQRLAVICYAQYDGKILFINRTREPFSGFLVPPGGKVEDGEGIEEAIRREFREETGLELNNLRLKMVTSEEGPEHYNWVLFIFVAELNSDKFIQSDEGELVWVEKDKIFEENLSPIDKALARYILDGSNKVKLAQIKYSEDKSIEDLKIEDLDSIFE